MGKRGPKSAFTDAQWEWIAERYVEGYTHQALADFIGVSRMYVAQKLYAMGVCRHPELLPLEHRKAEFNSLIES